ncbi:MerR family transcriptional regulator [Actinacidiphila guanduensis]|uniref:MerR family transcriptional regulator, Zn(II)-responsive regulator of zntA n=1 Tax=Actinacidiphila guanduensis TaxID=310781 RepID=A0A1H0PW25_9ACTN|nr:MerR family transcriptional regulator [Actinacidiphila guanduensis]SDP09303.1 MerR family transcriptional regulator, Zn(II)-responsive regulator of zntA [Actinacidiphila guanduensis]
MLIGEFARRVGVTTDTIRFYEKMGFFSSARADNGYRTYSEKDLETAELIATGKATGFSLREILLFTDEMAGGSIDHAAVQQSLQEKLDVIDARIVSLRRTRRLVQQQIDRCKAIEASEAELVGPGARPSTAEGSRSRGAS